MMTAYSEKPHMEIEPQPEASPVVVPGQRGESQDIIDLRFIFWIWLKWSWIALPLIAIGAYFGFRDLQSFSPVYVATITVAPVGGSSVGGGQLSPVLAGFGLTLGGPAKSAPFDRLKVMLGSITLAQRLQDRHGLLQVLFAEDWDAESGRWIKPPLASDREERIRILLHRPEWSPPNLETLADYVGGSIKTKPRAEPGFIRITFRNNDPDFALEFLKTIFFEADELLREQDRFDSVARLKYINTRLATEKLVDNVRALNSLLLSEHQSATLLGSGLPYAGRVIEPAYVSTTPTQPNLRVMFGLPISVSLGVGFLLLTVVAVFRRE